MAAVRPDKKRPLPTASALDANKKHRQDREKTVREFMQSLNASSKARASAQAAAADATTTHCPICTEKYSIRHKRLACPYSCGGEACTACHTRYLQEATTDFHCMKCRREWKLRFMRLHFSDKQLQTLYKQYQKVLVARDEAKLPDAQRVLEINTKIRRLSDKIVLLEGRIEAYRKRQAQLRANRRAALARNKTDGPPIKCITAECRGYLKRGICGVCHKRYCLKCMQQVARPKRTKKTVPMTTTVVGDSSEDEPDSESGSEINAEKLPESEGAAAAAAPVPDDPSGLQTLHRHVCQPEHLANMEYLRSNSKTCPKCGVWTSRTEGCNQMWCINCHAAWDWSTGQLVTGVIHNPHYFEWQQRTKAPGVENHNPHGVPCGGLPFRFTGQYEDHEFLNKVLRRVNEVNDTRVLRPPQEHPTLDMRLKYLRHKITREAWSTVIFRRYKLFKFKEQFFHIHQMFYLAATDILQRRHSQALNAADAKLELNNLRVYYNRELLETVRVNKGRYAKFYDLISPEWNMATWEHKKTVAEALTTEV